MSLRLAYELLSESFVTHPKVRKLPAQLSLQSHRRPHVAFCFTLPGTSGDVVTTHKHYMKWNKCPRSREMPWKKLKRCATTVQPRGTLDPANLLRIMVPAGWIEPRPVIENTEVADSTKRRQLERIWNIALNLSSLEFTFYVALRPATCYGWRLMRHSSSSVAKWINPNSMDDASCKWSIVTVGFLPVIASCARMVGSQSDRTWVSSGQRLARSRVRDSARAVSPAVANASAASTSTARLVGDYFRASLASSRASAELPELPKAASRKAPLSSANATFSLSPARNAEAAACRVSSRAPLRRHWKRLGNCRCLKKASISGLSA